MLENIKILTSKTDFTFDEIALKYLQHFINNFDASARPNVNWILMFMNNHDSYITSEFALLIDKYHIRSFTIIFHLTHCMQFLNVGIFQHYKHYHDVAIQNVMIEFNVEYFLIRFCQNLIWIRNNTFKKTIILFAFKKSEIYSIDAFECIVQLRKFVFNIQTKSQKNEKFLSIEFILFRIHFTTLKNVKYELNQWKSKIDVFMQWNDSARKKKLNQYVNHTREIIAELHFKKYELFLHQKRRHDELMQKIIFRKRLKFIFEKISITKKNALTIITEKRRKKNELIKKQKYNNFMRMWRMKRNDLLTKNIIARKEKKIKLKKIKNYTKRKIQMSDEDAISIINFEMKWKTSNSTWLIEKIKKTKTKSKH